MILRWIQRFAVPLVIVTIAVGSSGCLTPNTTTSSVPRDTVSRKLNPFVFFEEGGAMFVGVDTRAAQLSSKGTIFPLGLGIVNHTRGSMKFGKESFTLESSDGKRYPVVSVEEFNSNYNRTASDLRLADSFREIMLTRYGGSYIPQPWNPFALGRSGTSPDTLELTRSGWTQTYLYFPVPETGVKGRDFRLIVTPYGSPESYLVRFNVR